MNTDEIPIAILIHMAITMDFPEILALCSRNKEFNKGVCLNKWFWKSRLLKDYGIRNVPTNTTAREHFSKMYKLEQKPKKDHVNLYNKDNTVNSVNTIPNISLPNISLPSALDGGKTSPRVTLAPVKK